MKELCKKSFEKKYVQFRIHAEKDHLCFYKNFTNQAFIFISSKLVYFKKKWKFPLSLNAPYRHQTIDQAVGARAEPFYT